MRTIKFRGKRTDGQDWVYGGFHEHTKRQICPIGDELTNKDICSLIIQSGFADWNMPKPLQAVEVIPESVGQWTGLVDMDMVEAYEKDVVDVYFRDGEVERAVLIWDANRFKYQLKSSDGSLWGFNDTLRVKIIGNLIDSPELMEVE